MSLAPAKSLTYFARETKTTFTKSSRLIGFLFVLSLTVTARIKPTLIRTLPALRWTRNRSRKNGTVNIPFPMHYVIDREGKSG